MRKLLLLALVLLSIFLGYTLAKPSFRLPIVEEDRDEEAEEVKKPILHFAIVADSHGDNELLARALRQVFDREVFDPEAQTESAQGWGINFVIGLGDYSTVGMVKELTAAKKVFDNSGLIYLVTAGDHDLWDSRNRGEDALSNFKQVFGESNHKIEKNGIQIVILDNSDIYKGIDESQLSRVSGQLSEAAKLRFVFAHKTPFHPESKHIMGENSAFVAQQAQQLLSVIENGRVDGFFSGDLHFFAQFKSPNDAVKITTIGAVTRERNFQGPRFAAVTVYNDYSWEVEDVEIR